MIKSVLVLGGGSAGFLAAITLKVRLPMLTVTVMRSKEIGIIGVGEGTTTTVPLHLHGYLRLDAGEFHREAEPIWKLGNRFYWGKRPFFDYPFSRQYDTRFPGLPKGPGYYVQDNLADVGIPTAFMSRNRAFLRGPNGMPHLTASFAYHLENETFVRWLEKTATRLNIGIRDATVTEVRQDEQGITALALDDGSVATADLYVDASGFKSVLLGKALGEPFTSYKPSLFCDRAVVGGWKRGADEPIQPYTIAETMDSGWCWRIDHEFRINRGYVYSSAFISDEEAEKEFRRKNPKVEATRVVRFTAGRYERAWVKNVIGIGNSMSFVEPLEATSLGAICVCSKAAAEILADGDLAPSESLRALFNRVCARGYDAIRKFLAVHYKFNTRLDTPFWHECREKTDLAGAEPLVEFYQQNGPSSLIGHSLQEDGDPFGTEGYLSMFVGQQVPYRTSYPMPPADVAAWENIRSMIGRTADQGVPVPEALSRLRSPQWPWDPRTFGAPAAAPPAVART